MAVVPTKLRAPQSGASMPVSGRETMAKPVARDTMAKAQLIADEDVETAEGSSEIRSMAPLPGERDHHCTDPLWILLLLAALGVLYVPVTKALEEGDMSKYTSGFDYKGRMCGHDICDNGEVCGHFIYFCSKLGESGIDTFHPICIDSCPTSNLTSHLCYDEASMGPLLVQDWPTKEYGVKCLQRSHRLREDQEHLRKRLAGDMTRFKNAAHTPGMVLDCVASIAMARWHLLIVAFVSIAAGLMYMLFLWSFLDFLIHGSVVLVILMPTAFGVWNLFVFHNAGGIGAAVRGDSQAQDVTQHHSSGSTEPGCQRGLGMDSTCISCFVILLIVGSMVLLALEADSCARYGLHDLPDFFVWANLVVFLLFALEMGFRLRLCRCPCPDVLCCCCRPLGFIASCACECQARFTALASRIAKKSPDVLLVLDLLVVGMQGVDVGVSMAARLAAGSELHATAYLRIAQYLRWFRIVRCLRFIPAFASMKVQMDLIKGAVVPLLSAVFVLFFSISTVATLVTAVVADACRQQPDVGSCGEHFESLWESMYNVFMGTFGGLDFDDLVRPIRSVSPLACIIISVYMTLIYLMMMTVLTAHLCQKAVETASADQVEGRLKRLFQEILLLGEITDGRNQISLDRFTEALKDRRIKELFEQLDISTEEVRNRAHKLFKLIDENQNKHVEEREFVRGIMRLRSPAKNLKLWEVQWEMQSELSRIRRDQSQIRKMLERSTRNTSPSASDTDHGKILIYGPPP